MNIENELLNLDMTTLLLLLLINWIFYLFGWRMENGEWNY